MMIERTQAQMNAEGVKEVAREVPAQLNELTVIVQRLSEAVDEIGVVLLPVISKNPLPDPSANAPSNTKDPHMMCDTAESIRGNRQRILESIIALQDLSSQVEL